MVHFCSVSGARIAKPGVSKSIDSELGHDEVVEFENGSVMLVAELSKAKPEAEKSKAAPSKNK